MVRLDGFCRGRNEIQPSAARRCHPHAVGEVVVRSQLTEGKAALQIAFVQADSILNSGFYLDEVRSDPDQVGAH